MTDDLPDKRYIAGNVRVACNVFSVGALCYVVYDNPGGGSDRVKVLGRSRGGRWVETWIAMSRLHNFRFKAIPPSHPRYGDMRLYDRSGQWETEYLRRLVEASERHAPRELPSNPRPFTQRTE